MGGFCYNEPQSVVPVYFVVRLSKPAEIRYWKRLDRLKGIRHEWEPYSDKYKIYSLYSGEMAGDDIGAVFTFATEQDEQVEVSFDGSHVTPLRTGDRIRIARSDKVTEFIRLNQVSFLEVLHRKMQG